MYAIEVSSEFSATHQLRLADGNLESLHGHNWHVVVRLAADRLDALGTVLDFHAVESALEVIVAPWRNRHLNDVAPFAAGALNPSAELVAEAIGRALGAVVERMETDDRRVRVVEARVTEAAGCVGIWRA